MKLLLLLVPAVLCSGTLYADETTCSSDRWDHAVCLVEETTDNDGKKETQFGSGFIVEKDDGLVLVTAAHVAKFTSAKSKLLFRTPDGDARWLLMGALGEGEGSPWILHPQADLAVMPLSTARIDAKHMSYLVNLAISLGDVSAETPQRSSKIEFAGFPLLLGVTPSLSPLVMCATVASRETQHQGKWGLEKIYWAHPVVGDGVSGGPVFAGSEDPADLKVVGMYVGYVSDKSGPKLARVVPSRLVRELIGKF